MEGEAPKIYIKRVRLDAKKEDLQIGLKIPTPSTRKSLVVEIHKYIFRRMNIPYKQRETWI